MIEDPELLRRYCDEGSEEAFTELVRRRIGFVYSLVLRRTHNPPLAEEVAQKVFIALARNAKKLSRRETLLGWLHLTAYHCAIDLHRVESRRRRRETEVQLLDESFSGEPSSVNWEIAGPVLDAALAELRATDRDAVLLRFFEGKRLAEIGSRLNLSENAVRMRIDRSIARLRAKLAVAGIGSSLAALEAAIGSEVTTFSAPTALASTVARTALASAAPGGAVCIVAFMTTSKTALGLVGLAAALALFFSGEELIRAVHNRAVLRELHARDSTDRATLRAAVLQASHLETDLATGRTRNATRGKSAASWDPVEQGQSFLRRHPEIQQQLAEYRRLAFRARYGAFADRLHLTGAELERLQNLMITAPSLPWGPGGKLITIDYNDPPASNAEFIAGLTDILGEKGVAALESCDESSKAQDTTAKLAAALCFSDAPLTAAQADQFTAAILAHNIPHTATQNARLDWSALVTASASFLNPAQIAAVTVLQSQATLNAPGAKSAR